MKLVLTSDWQVEFSNLQNCETSLKELIRATKKYKPDAIIHGGDLKEAYSPVDVRVPKFWVRAIPLIATTGCRFIALMGNHDRISQSRESKNWMDILRAAGAETVTQPRWKKVGEGEVAFLPFTADKKQEIEWADQLANSKPAGSMPTVLIFHTEVKGAKLNSVKEAEGNTAGSLHFDRYTACFGAHLHIHQRISRNAWYIGSPFAMDWSDVNQTKGHVLAEVTL